VTFVAAATLTVHVPVPVQPPPLQPVNVEPALGAAVRTTDWPKSYEEEHVAPQVMPAGVELTVPAPVPAFATVTANVCSVKVAVTLRAAVMETVHVPVPPQAPPLQPVNVEPTLGEAVRTTDVPSLKVPEHVAPQLMAAGVDETLPEPEPALVTVSVWVVGVGIVKFAVTVVAAVTDTVHVPVPEQAPPQPVKSAPPVGDAVSVTD